MQPVFLFPLTAAFLFSVGALFDKFILENKMPNATAFFFLQSFTAVVLFPILSILIFGLRFPSPFSLLLTLFAAITSSIGFLIYFLLLKNYDLSSVGPLVQTRLLFAIPLAFFFLNEFYGFGALLLMLLIFLGAVLTTYCKEFSVRALLLNNRLLLLAMVLAIVWALADLPAKIVVNEITAPSFMAWRYILSIPVIGLFALLVFKGDARKAFSKNLLMTLPFSLAATFIGFTGIMLILMAYAFSYTIPSALVLSQAIFVFVIALIVSRLKSSLISEKQPMKVYLVRLVGVLLIISSIYFLMNSSMVL